MNYLFGCFALIVVLGIAICFLLFCFGVILYMGKLVALLLDLPNPLAKKWDDLMEL